MRQPEERVKEMEKHMKLVMTGLASVLSVTVMLLALSLGRPASAGAGINAASAKKAIYKALHTYKRGSRYVHGCWTSRRRAGCKYLYYRGSGKCVGNGFVNKRWYGRSVRLSSPTNKWGANWRCY
jgi:hypothetical protein